MHFLSLDKRLYLNNCTDLFTKAISWLARMKSNIDPHPGHVNLKDNEVQANEQKNINDFSFKNWTSSLYKGVSNKNLDLGFTPPWS